MANANRTAPRLGIDDPDAWTAQEGIVKLDLTPFSFLLPALLFTKALRLHKAFLQVVAIKCIYLENGCATICLSIQEHSNEHASM
jgi:hypothetical protein